MHEYRADDSAGAGQFPVALLWHMHQPEYRVRGQFQLPWVALHALSAYTDMAAHLEEFPDARAVVNFTPVLLDQLQDLAQRLGRSRRTGVPIGDPLLDALRELPPEGPERAALVRRCLPVHPNRRTQSVPRYADLTTRVAAVDPATLPDALLADLLACFCLSWTGTTLRARDRRVQALLQHDDAFGIDQRRLLLEVFADALQGLLPRWQALAQRQQIELSLTPYYHPLLPLLLDFASAHDTAPGVPLPEGDYPGGAHRAHWHVDEALRSFEAVFGLRPAGCWPSEAALSDATLDLLEASGFAWTASGRSVHSATLQHAGVAQSDTFGAYARPGQSLRCAFRDDGLSDLVGFAYQHRDADEAVADLVGHLERIAAQPGRSFVLIALDGENPWEFYPEHGAAFLRSLYRALVAHPRLRLATLSDCVRREPVRTLPPLRAGSWVQGQLLTWIGHPEKNRAWELLMDAKRRVDASGRRDAALLHRLGACEGSDWFWWPGAHNPTPSVEDFDALFRAHLRALYEELGEPAPAILDQPFAKGVEHAVAAGGTMQKANS